MNPESVVRDFCRAVSRRDVAELASFFAEDAVYHNMPVGPVEGREAVEGVLRQFIDPDGEAEFEILGLAADGSRVYTERVDRFVLRGRRVELPVMGTFEVTPEGKIRAWRDYFDLASFTRQLG